MYPPPSSSSPTSPSFPGSSLGISKPAVIKAFTLLIFFWLLAGFSRFHRNDDGDTVTIVPQDNQETIDVSIPVDSDIGSPSFKDGSNSNSDTNNNIPSTPTSLLASPKPTKQVITTPTTTTLPGVKKHTDRVAVIIENRPLENLIPVMLHFHSVLGPEWPIIFYTVPATAANLSVSAPFRRAVDEGRIEVRFLPSTASLSSHRAVSLFLTDAWIWEDLAPYEKVLMFQDDSIVCSASPQRVDDFLRWDLIGAPIDRAYGQGYNGGLSLRSRALVLEILGRHSWAADSEVPGAPANMKFEDQWLYTRMQELPARADGTPGANLPGEEVARRFAVETVWSEEMPLGFHQPMRWQKGNMAKIMKYCPEVGMIGGAAFF
ncbi:hypothetical protein BKA67DRAFT_267830 [Truncatella angustata]|uniref:DUF5672 domain-containing protein n=1 Tax=Truncatella angustata TaxID=152316 RepID=A0A9P8UKN4_9PEZI|nr:uncharacterized protein BKA67DRAFT_267830 [Truncatella angustata]KAH6654012.1 hypothetical protein BKA67DRAFT_267830 [Truncatella angustata]KAH8194612.1 hypothetical protein TruAng_011219 [Truncatella angustata]